jgi:hypothetical protein
MKKLNLQLGSIKEMLTKEQMKKVAGGYTYNAYDCTEYYKDDDFCGGWSFTYTEYAPNLGNASYWADWRCKTNNCCDSSSCSAT